MTVKAGFLASPLGRGANAVVDNEPYVTYQFDPEPGAGMTLSFKGERLESLAWSLQMPAEDPSNWSVETEIRRKDFHDQWLRRELGEPPYRYGWGEIASVYDSKGASSAIIMVYGR